MIYDFMIQTDYQNPACRQSLELIDKRNKIVN